MKHGSRVLLALIACVHVSACGGGGGAANAGDDTGGKSASIAYTPGVFQPSTRFADQCARPRTGMNASGQPYPDRQGSVESENHFLRSWTNELYLWYREVPDRDPAADSTPDYFDQLVTPATTASGQPKDRFHFTYDTAEYEALSQAGVSVDYGAQWVILSSRPQRRFVVAYVEPNSPAARAGLARGAEILRIDDVDVVNDNTQAAVNVLIAALSPAVEGESHRFEIRESGMATTRTVVLSATRVTSHPVLEVAVLPSPSGPVGYILFNDHIATSEPALMDAVYQLRAQQIVDLVLDLRYNGGGFLDIASELAYMIGGASTLGRTFERIIFNDKHPSTNPVTGRPLTPTAFHTTTQILEPRGQPLPVLDLPQPRLYVITGSGTCSASESIINSLRGVGVEVYQIGSTTCGKPYGFYPRDNCGTTYFSIQFQGVNELGFGDYADGFSPQNTTGLAGEPLPGCSVSDDFTHALGDPAEARLAATLAFRAANNDSAACPSPPMSLGSGTRTKPGQRLSAAEGVLLRSPLRENRILADW